MIDETLVVINIFVLKYENNSSVLVENIFKI